MKLSLVTLPLILIVLCNLVIPCFCNFPSQDCTSGGVAIAYGWGGIQYHDDFGNEQLIEFTNRAPYQAQAGRQIGQSTGNAPYCTSCDNGSNGLCTAFNINTPGDLAHGYTYQGSSKSIIIRFYVLCFPCQ
jgi:hypothetical protein